MRPVRHVLTLVWIVGLASRVLAQGAAPDPHTAQPERPTVATHAGTVAPGWVELEAGGEWDRYPDVTRGAVAPLLLKIGLARRVQLGVQGGGVWAPGDTGRGIGDFTIDVKWRILDDAPILGDFAVLPAITTPTGSVARGTGTGTTGAGLLLISSHSVRGVAIDLNAGYLWRTGDGSVVSREGASWTASFGGTALGRLGWCAEIFGYPSVGRGAVAPIVALLAGPTLQVKPWLVLDVGAIAPITGPQPRAIYSGVTWNIGRLWHAPAARPGI